MAEVLNDYYIISRYPDDIGEKIVKEEVQMAYNYAKEL
ncbi:MAG TPA: hypothetical protein DEP72_09285 [Clostridiales bacterium]|nr:hypothetical protein [Clostridiales bacterium]